MFGQRVTGFLTINFCILTRKEEGKKATCGEGPYIFEHRKLARAPRHGSLLPHIWLYDSKGVRRSEEAELAGDLIPRREYAA